MEQQIALFHDEPGPSVVTRLRTLANDQDRSYLRLPKRLRGTAGTSIDFGQFIDVYFWDTDFLTDAQMFSDLTPETKRQLGFSAEVFGVTHGLALHPDELVLKRCQEDGTDKTKGQNHPDED